MKNIILIGFMGCGKTSVGKRLSETLGCAFLDTDELIEEAQKRSIREIFDTDGEMAFRAMETDCLKDLRMKEQNGFVLSVGGGLPMREENRVLLKQLGDVILLQVSPDVVYQRLKNDRTRPLLQDRNPRGRILDLMSARKKCYEDAADHIIPVDERTFEQIIDDILSIRRKEEPCQIMRREKV